MTPVERTLSLAWIGLIALTLVSFAAAESLLDRRFAIVAIFAVAAIKGQVVAGHFMEVGHALPHWRALYRVWIFGIALVLAAGHIL
jgi:heme/copper-type cytochrome/quinol oxidase subunit 4